MTLSEEGIGILSMTAISITLRGSETMTREEGSYRTSKRDRLGVRGTMFDMIQGSGSTGHIACHRALRPAGRLKKLKVSSIKMVHCSRKPADSQ